MKAISREKVAEVVRYDPETGLFRWVNDRPRGPHPALAGDVVHRTNCNGYIWMHVHDRRYLAHRLAWLLVHGSMPTGWLDHVNGDRADNRIANLRPADGRTNAANSRGWKRTGTGLKGAYPSKRGRPWFASIRVNRKLIHLGTFDTEIAAHEAYVVAAREHFGEYANAGKAAAHLQDPSKGDG